MVSLKLPDNFIQGVTPYLDEYPGNKDRRIVIEVRFNYTVLVPAILDTGAPWSILASEYVEIVGIESSQGLEEKTLEIRGMRYHGWLHRMPISVEAEEGEGLTVEATVFVPVSNDMEPNLPLNFLGLIGFMDQVRFAVDPETNLFYFGSISQQ